MIELVTREKTFENDALASMIYGIQKLNDPREDDYWGQEGIYFDSNIDKERHFNQDEITEIKEQELKQFMFYTDRLNQKTVEFTGSIIYNLKFSDIHVYAIKLGEVFKRMSILFKSNIHFILENKTPWLIQKNELRNVKKALEFLEINGVSEEYYGAISASGDELAELIENLFWLIRCNANLPICWFSTDNDKFVGNICHYGNIHFETYSATAIDQIKEFGNLNNLIQIENCQEGFSETGAIQGREIDV